MVVRKSTGTKAAVSGGVASLSSPASELGAGGPASLCRVPLLAPGAVSVSSVVTAAWPSLSLSPFFLSFPLLCLRWRDAKAVAKWQLTPSIHPGCTLVGHKRLGNRFLGRSGGVAVERREHRELSAL